MLALGIPRAREHRHMRSRTELATGKRRQPRRLRIALRHRPGKPQRPRTFIRGRRLSPAAPSPDRPRHSYPYIRRRNRAAWPARAAGAAAGRPQRPPLRQRAPSTRRGRSARAFWLEHPGPTRRRNREAPPRRAAQNPARPPRQAVPARNWRQCSPSAPEKAPVPRWALRPTRSAQRGYSSPASWVSGAPVRPPRRGRHFGLDPGQPGQACEASRSSDGQD